MKNPFLLILVFGVLPFAVLVMPVIVVLVIIGGLYLALHEWLIPHKHNASEHRHASH